MVYPNYNQVSKFNIFLEHTHVHYNTLWWFQSMHSIYWEKSIRKSVINYLSILLHTENTLISILSLQADEKWNGWQCCCNIIQNESYMPLHITTLHYMKRRNKRQCFILYSSGVHEAHYGIYGWMAGWI